MAASDKVQVPSLAFELMETIQVLSECSGTIGAVLTRIDLSSRQALETAISTYMSAVREMPRYVPQRGDYVLARSELSEPRWCRALVLDVSFSLVQVDHIDYGYTENVRLTDVTELPSSLATLPAYSVRLKVDVTQFSVGGKYEVFIGNYVDDLYRTVEASSAVEADPPTYYPEELSEALVIPEDVGEVENGVVRGIRIDNDNTSIYGIQHREGFEAMADQLAQSELQLKYPVNEGDFVVVPFDAIFCRGLVLEVGAESAKVYHVDFGSWDTVSLSNLFWLPVGPTSETPQLSFQCITDDASRLEENQQYRFEVFTTLKDHGYPLHVCKASLPAFRVTNLPEPCLQVVETVQLIDKPCLDGGHYGTLHLESNTTLTEIEQQLEESFGGPGVDFLSEPKVGDLVISYIDGRFYRSVVCEISDAEICVFQIDVGTFRNCSNSVVMTLPEKLLAYPPVALLCLLDENQSAIELATSFQAQNFVKHSTMYGINVYTFETVGVSSDASPDLGYATSEEVPSGEVSEYYPADGGTEEALVAEVTEELIAHEHSEVQVLDASYLTAIESHSRAVTPSSRTFEATPRKLHHRTFPASSLEDIESSFLDVKIINVSVSSEVTAVLSVALLDRQDLLEEALSFIEQDTLKPLYSSDLLSRSPGVMKSGEYWVRVVVVERPSPSSYSVQLVDYGVQVTCSVGEVFCCPAEYVPIEMCVVDCQVPKANPGTEMVESLIGQIVVLGRSTSNTFAMFSRETGEAITL